MLEESGNGERNMVGCPLFLSRPEWGRDLELENKLST